MNVTITPTRLSGAITPPPSKSQAHRLLIAAALAGGVSVIENVALSQDISATLACMKALGAGAVERGSAVELHGLGHSIPQAGPVPVLDCGESGSTLRFLIPIALAVTGGAAIRFTGRGRLLARPQKPYEELFREKSLFFAHEAQSIAVAGNFSPGEFSLPGNVSSQFITGLLYALPLIPGCSVIRVTTPLESADYVAMTLDTLEQFGIRVKNEDFRTFRIPGGQTYQPRRLAVEADWSQAGFWYAAAAIGNDVTVTGMPDRSVQGDACIAPLSRSLSLPGDGELDVSQCPDLVPPLAAMGALRTGTLCLSNAGRLRIKESDRLAAVTDVLTALGAEVHEEEDRLIIAGKPSLAGGVTVSSHNDHRIAMMAAVAASRCESPVTIRGAECVAKSYPNFWEDYEALGGKIEKSEV